MNYNDSMLGETVYTLVYQCGEIAKELGEKWRTGAGAEFMDALQAVKDTVTILPWRKI